MNAQQQHLADQQRTREITTLNAQLHDDPYVPLPDEYFEALAADEPSEDE